MPTTRDRTTPKIALALALGLLLTVAEHGAAARSSRHWSLEWDGAYLWPRQAAFREIYTDQRLSSTLRLAYVNRLGIGLYGGYRYYQSRGRTQTEEQVVNEEEVYRTELKVHGPQAGILLAFTAATIRFQVAAGLSYHYYREKWRDAPYSFSGKCLGYQADAHIAMPLVRRLSVFLKLAFLSMPTKKGSLLQSSVDLGGFETGIGLMFHF